MKNFFWIDEERHLYKTEREFIADLNKITYVRKYNNEKNPYNMVVQLAAGMMHGLETYLLDPEWSSHELANMGLSDEKINEVYPLSSPGGTTSLGDLIGMVREQDWKMWLFTSGSTGIPKRVCHTFQTLARNVKKSDRHQRDCWAFAYKISHMAGIQVFLQAILNENSLVYVFESQPVQIIAAMQKYHCTRISATPTFYRTILPYMDGRSLDLVSMTMGGERFDDELCASMKRKLPRVKIHNVYASTETGTLLQAKGKGFVIPKQYADKIKLSSQGEILIHRSLAGEFLFEGDWYNSHDIACEEDGVLYFQSRDMDFVNVGGDKVNLVEVEQAILCVESVQDCVVKSRKNSVVGNVLCAEIVPVSGQKEKTIKKEVIAYLKEHLQGYKIPRLFTFVSSIQKTRTGKKVRS